MQGLREHGARGTRAPDLLGAIQALSQMSYSPERVRQESGSCRPRAHCSRPRQGGPSGRGSRLPGAPAPAMPLLQPSFRGRLRLFFAVIVIVPMIAVGLVLFQLLDASGDYKLDSGLDQAQKTAKALYQDDRQAAIGALEPFRDDRRLAT